MPLQRLLPTGVALFAAAALHAQPYATKPLIADKFRQLEELLPTPNDQRTASGAPGRAYWQQRADYTIDAELDDTNQSITGRETIVYTNRSPDTLTYLWVQLDANIFAKDSDNRTTTSGSPRATPGSAVASGTTSGGTTTDRLSYRSLESILLQETYDSNLKVTAVTDSAGAPLPHTIVKTMMRVD